ncbi:Crp/Fnr family transcriptional regulator [Pseudogracilibacillus auburnensis]|uniref:Crp/Fnr family transcriptional regulator n=1 Tax=Pseudogracilibacillus auburnensis TaxID=1494959 RepID=UPI001A9709E6|nr:Crp/Fnr family transcriptional regulator [Pseudogracilibacillus auburnensis]MBO1005086.1 Crp/Fnr family transcriptional regulator [Pseudogracilibacillus auburnensis]
MTNGKASQFLHKVPLFNELNEHEMTRVEEIMISRFIPKKGIVFSEGSEKEAVYFIQEGLVKTYKTDENGHEQIVSFLKAGDMFPHTGFFNKNPYPATAETIIDAKLMAIPLKTFESLMMDTPSIAIKMMRVMGDIISELQERLQVLSGRDVKQRALSFLLMLAEQHGKTKGDKTIIDLPMTNLEFANSVGTTRETINRLFNQLIKDKILDMDRNRIVIMNWEALKGFIE